MYYYIDSYMKKKNLPNILLIILFSILISWGVVAIVFDSIFIYEQPTYINLIEVACAVVLASGVAIVYNRYENSHSDPIALDNQNKLLGVILLFLVYGISIVVYIFTLNITALSIVYTFFLVRTIIYIYASKINHIKNASLTILIVLLFISLYFGSYLAYVREDYAHFISEGYEPFEIVFNYYSLINKLDLDIMPFVYVFTFLLHSIGIFANRQFIKRNININNIQTLEDKSQHISVLKKIVTLLLIGSLSICAQLQMEHINNLVVDQKLERSLGSELQALKLKNKDAYNKAVETFDGYIKDYNFQIDLNYQKLDVSTTGVIKIYANFDTDDCSLKANVEDFGTGLTYEWGEWQKHNGKNSYIELNIKAFNEGYAVITISNSVNDETIPIFIDNYTYTK